jgi:phosphoribosylanthranilate isomerase
MSVGARHAGDGPGIFVKICGIRDRAHAEAAVDAGADALGFVFAESPRNISPGEASVVTQGLPRGLKRVAVMWHPSNDEWQEVLETFHPDALQTDIEDFDALHVPDTIARWPVIRQFPQLGPDTMTVPDTVMVSGPFVYEGAESGAGETVDWSRAAEIAGHGSMILAGGLTPANVGEAIARVRPWGVDVSSGVELERGVKDSELIRQFIGAVRAAEKEL